MAKYRGKKRRSGGRSKKMPLAIVVPMAVPAMLAAKYAMAGNFTSAQHVFTGIQADGSLDTGRLMATYVPMLSGVIIHKAAGRLGVNRYLPKWLPVSI